MTQTITKKLRSKQQDGFLRLFRHLMNGSREVVMSGPTGCGKSLMATYLVERLLRTGQYISAAVVVPQTQIQDGFLHSVPVAPVQDGLPRKARRAAKSIKNERQDFWIQAGVALVAGRMSVLGDILVEHKRWGLATGKRMEQFHKHVRASNPSVKVLVTTHQAVSKWFGLDPALLPADLKGRILVIDEAHHASSANQIGAFAKAWKDRGGTIIHLTATPFRTEGDILIDPGAPRWTLTLAEHIESGYAPRVVKIRSRPIPMVARTVKELVGDRMGLVSDLTASATAVADMLGEEGKLKAAILVPIIGAGDWAAALQAVLEARGFRVFNAVKGGSACSRGLRDALNAERAAAGVHYDESKYDVFLACARFNEGTDWPFCSHVYNIGLTNSFQRIIQRLGRGMRPKTEIRGYPELHKDQVVFTFLVPSVSEEVFATFEQKHLDHAFMTACFMADVDTGQGYLSDVTRRLEDSRPRSGKYRPSDETWANVMDFLKGDVQECRKAAEHMVRAINALRDEGVPKPNDGQVVAFLKARMGLEGEDLARVVRAIEYNGMKRNALAFQGFKARLLQKLRNVQDYKGDHRIIQKDLQPLFDAMLVEFADEVADLELASKVVGHMSRFVGRTCEDVGRSMRKRFGLPQPTEDEIVQALRRYVAKEGRRSPPLADDASEHFKYAPGMYTWQDANNRLAWLQGGK